MNLPRTLTEAQSSAPFTVTITTNDATASNARPLTYRDRYFRSSGAMETPIENLLKAVEEEKRQKGRN